MKLSEEYNVFVGVKGGVSKDITPRITQLEAENEAIKRGHLDALEISVILATENEALGELLSPLVDIELERDTLKAENEALREFVVWVHKDECASLLAGNAKCDCGYALLTVEEPFVGGTVGTYFDTSRPDDD